MKRNEWVKKVELKDCGKSNPVALEYVDYFSWFLIPENCVVKKEQI